MKTVLYLNEIKGDSYEVVKTRRTPNNYSRTGYGCKLPTSYMVIDHNDHGRARRVYAICYSNAASYYVLISGVMYFIRECDIPETPRVIGLPDARYTVTLEFCGEVSAKYILRFCGCWVSKHDTRDDAENAAGIHYDARR